MNKKAKSLDLWFPKFNEYGYAMSYHRDCALRVENQQTSSKPWRILNELGDRACGLNGTVLAFASWQSAALRADKIWKNPTIVHGGSGFVHAGRIQRDKRKHEQQQREQFQSDTVRDHEANSIQHARAYEKALETVNRYQNWQGADQTATEWLIEHLVDLYIIQENADQ